MLRAFNVTGGKDQDGVAVLNPSSTLEINAVAGEWGGGGSDAPSPICAIVLGRQEACSRSGRQICLYLHGASALPTDQTRAQHLCQLLLSSACPPYSTTALQG
jgi:hypothetical protein